MCKRKGAAIHRIIDGYGLSLSMAITDAIVYETKFLLAVAGICRVCRSENVGNNGQLVCSQIADKTRYR